MPGGQGLKWEALEPSIGLHEFARPDQLLESLPKSPVGESPFSLDVVHTRCGEHMVSFKALVNFTWSLPERRKDFLCEERPPSSEVAQWVKIPITKPGDPSTISGSHKVKQDSQKLSADLHT